MPDYQYFQEPDYDDIDTKDNWICQICYSHNWLKRINCRNKNCRASKKLFESVSNEDWLILKSSYSNEINDIFKWKFSKLSNKIADNATIYDRIIASQQFIFLNWAQKDPVLQWTIDLDTVPESAISYVRDLMNNSTNSLENNVKDDTIDKYVSTLWPRHKLLFLKTAKASDKDDVIGMIEYVQKVNPLESERAHYNGDDYDESFAKIMKIIVKQFVGSSDLCNKIREKIIKKYSEYITNNTHVLKYPVEVERYTGFIENPFFDGFSKHDIVKEWVNDELELWSFIISKYIYDDVRLCVEIVDSKHVRFCWAWTDHSW